MSITEIPGEGVFGPPPVTAQVSAGTVLLLKPVDSKQCLNQ